ncbi:DdRp [Dasineura jujubifolia toursvirus 2a]|nr:DdRp [Dasineura jujubifolia toursvirus 2a]
MENLYNELKNMSINTKDNTKNDVSEYQLLDEKFDETSGSNNKGFVFNGNDYDAPKKPSTIDGYDTYDTIEKFFSTYGMIRHQFDTFHDFVFFGIQDVINDEPNIYFNNGMEVKFKNIRIEKPSITLNNKTKIKLYPSMAREKSLTYEFGVIVDVHQTINSETTITPINLCLLPAMVRSAVCNLYEDSYSPVQHNEVMGDLGGYFIINGKERIITGQTRKTYNRGIVTKNLENEYVCEFRSCCEETSKSSNIQIKYSKKGTIEMFIDKISTNLGNVLDALGIIDHLDVLIGNENIFFDEAIYTIKKFRTQEKLHFDVTQFMHHMGYSSNFSKGVFLCKMIRKLILAEIGVIKEEEKNNLAYKRVDMVGILCKDLFKMLWKQFIKSLTKEFEKRKVGSIIPIINIKKKNIRINFYYCFSTGTWGIKKNSYKKLGVSEFAQNKVSSLTNLALLRKFNIPVGKKDKNINIRQLHSSSAFYVCPFETPEGASVGTRLTLSALAFVSSQMPFVLLREILESSPEKYYKEFNSVNQEQLLALNALYYTISINGYVVGWVDNKYEAYITVDKIKQLRNKDIIRNDVSIYINDDLGMIEIWSDTSRFIRPLFVTEKLIKLQHSLKNMSFKDMENCGLIVYRDPLELELSYVSIDYRELDEESEYTEIHPTCLMGLVAAQIPFTNHTQSPRVCYMSNMIKQAIGILPCLGKPTDATLFSLDYVQKPLNTPRMADITGVNEYPNGVNAIVAIASYTGFNQEDSVILNQGAIDRGLFKANIKRTICTEVKTYSTTEETICIPPPSCRLNKDYSKLDENGLVMVGTTIVKGDIIVGKINKIKTKNGCRIEDKSISAKATEEGVVDSVIQHHNVIKITITQTKIPEIGDKFCSGMAQKGTCGMILPECDMPFTSSGMIPDIIINPHCMPSRMTINQLMSTVCAKARAITADSKFSDGSPFQKSGDRLIDTACEELLSRGFSADGNETMYNGMTGHKIKSKIFIGPVYYHRLTHLVSNKLFSYTNTNVKNKLTRQPLNGRSNDGGLRIGEMEKDCLLRHGIVKFSHERLMDLSDKYTMKICNSCNGYYHVIKDAQENYICNKCKTIDISTVTIPYAAKLLTQELESMGLNVTLNA